MQLKQFPALARQSVLLNFLVGLLGTVSAVLWPDSLVDRKDADEAAHELVYLLCVARSYQEVILILVKVGGRS